MAAVRDWAEGPGRPGRGRRWGRGGPVLALWHHRPVLSMVLVKRRNVAEFLREENKGTWRGTGMGACSGSGLTQGGEPTPGSRVLRYVFSAIDGLSPWTGHLPRLHLS